MYDRLKDKLLDDPTQNIVDTFNQIHSVIAISDLTSYYLLYILEHIRDIILFSDFLPDHFKKFPLNIDFPRYNWGVGKEGTSGIFALDTALSLEVAAYQLKRERKKLHRKGESESLSKRVGYLWDKNSLNEWKRAIETKYSIENADSYPVRISSFFD